MRFGKKLLVLGVSLLLAVVLGEGLCSYYLAKKHGRPRSDRKRIYDADLGWKNTPGFSVENLEGMGERYTHNSMGFRATTEYAKEIPVGKFRIVCVGDSFTYGICGDEVTYPRLMEESAEVVQTINMGTGAFGVDQAYLWYLRDGTRYDADVLLFAFIAPDVKRMELPTFHVRYPKPMLRMVDGELVATNVPVPTWGAADRGWLQEFPRKTALYLVARSFYDRAFNRHADPFPIAAQAFRAMKRISQERGQDFALVYLPTEGEVRTEELPVGELVRDFAAAEGIFFLSLTEVFKGLSPDELEGAFRHDGHYSGVGNQLVADHLLAELARAFPELAIALAGDQDG